jgi:4-diphosphocytidyl-2-C-methyl-D-erythritol kinase
MSLLPLAIISLKYELEEVSQSAIMKLVIDLMKEKAYAKINLFLNVVNKRFDGYHDLEMVMAPIDFFDELSFEKTKTNEITITSNVHITTHKQENIVYKIATYLQKEFNINKGVNIHINKQIPMGAGLGGGSADAAAALRGLNRFWKLKLSLDQLATIGLEFGSDVPFCVYNKLAIAKGRGENLVFIDNTLNIPVLLVNPNIHISTKEVFSHIQEERLLAHKISNMTNAIYNNNIQLIIQELHNSLEQITFAMEPQVESIKKQMMQMGLEGALMSGSGATVFGLCTSTSKLKEVAQSFGDSYFVLLTKIR